MTQMRSFTVTYTMRDGTPVRTETMQARTMGEARMRAKDIGGRLRVTVAKRATPPQTIPERHLVVPSADYWFQQARSNTHPLAERLMYMENAVNHLENCLIAASKRTE